MNTSSKVIEFQISLVSSLVEMYIKMQKHTRCVEIVRQDVHTQVAERPWNYLFKCNRKGGNNKSPLGGPYLIVLK
jgi:hypothetical protein